MATTAAPTAAQTAQAQANANMMARQAIVAQAVKMQQQIFTGPQTVNTPSTGFVATYNPRNVGLILGFWVKVVHNISNGSGVQIDLTDMGPFNALANIAFNDYQNVNRINTFGWHVGLINSARLRRPSGAAILHGTGYDTPPNFGNNATAQISAPATIAASGTGTVTMWYWVPLSYSSRDLRGSLYANITNAQATLNLTLPGAYGVNVAVANGADSTLAMYVGNASGSVSAVSITSTTIAVYQYYYDQLPLGRTSQGGVAVALPQIDLGTVYQLQSTQLSSISPNQEFPYQYSNFRNFLSTTVCYVNTAATGARTGGTDVNYWALQAANATYIWKKEPGLVAMENRNMFTTDFPPGFWQFESREKPIITNQYGNMQLILNPSTAGTGAYLLVGVENLALQTALSNAGSLPAS